MLYGRITGLVLSLFLPAFYRAVARNWGGIGLLYLLLLFLLTWIPVVIQMHAGLQRFARDEFPKFAKEIPDVTLKGGKVSSPIPQPLEVKDEQGNVVFVLDTTGKINNLDQTQAKLLVTETKLHQRDDFGRVQVQELAIFPDFELTAASAQGWFDLLASWAWIAIYVFGVIGSMIRAFVIMLIASLIGLIFNSAFNARVTYGGLLRFAAVGITLSIYIDTANSLADLHVPFYFFIALALTIGYVAFGTYVSIPPPMDLGMDPARDDMPVARPRDPYDGSFQAESS